MEQFHSRFVKQIVKATGRLETRFASQDVTSFMEGFSFFLTKN